LTETPFFYVLTDATRLLVVDDDPITREFATVYLSSPVASVETASNGQEALDRIDIEQFDIVLLDVDMPGLSGFDVLKEIRKNVRSAHLPVLMITGREDISSIDLAYELGASSFVTKPLNWRLLAYQVRYVLRSSVMQRAS